MIHLKYFLFSRWFFFFSFLISVISTKSQEIDGSHFEYVKTDSFLELPLEADSEIEWAYLSVPQNWEKRHGKRIKLAVAKIASFRDGKNIRQTVFVQGGPGGGTLGGIRRWLNHPLREVSDIILLDLRGTGFSEPNLCPDLGKEILQILAKNQSQKDDKKEKVAAALGCRDSLIKEGIDINTYNSYSVAHDLHALKSAIGTKQWNVYGVSYGTYTTQVYAELFPDDINSIVLDSPISSIDNYFDQNTSNYVSSLNLLFRSCKEDINCNSKYPNLENVYYSTIQKLETNPITVQVDESIIPSGEFTYNMEDFKIAIQQSLYQKKLVEILPMLIYEFNRQNKATLGNLVAAFSGALSLDYGVYYCTTCSETINKNSLVEYEEDSNKEKRLKGGLSFYRSDYEVCQRWNNLTQPDTDRLEVGAAAKPFPEIPTLLFSGGFDPITPSKNAAELAQMSKNVTIINLPNYGHGTSYTDAGKNILKDFISENVVDVNKYNVNDPISFITKINSNGGVAKFAGSLGKFDIIELLPLIIAILTVLVTMISLITTMKRSNRLRKLITILFSLEAIIVLLLIVGLIYALQETVKVNFYILAMGLEEKFSYLFILPYLSLFIFVVICILYAFNFKKLSAKTLIFACLFSLFLYHLYLFNWELMF